MSESWHHAGPWLDLASLTVRCQNAVYSRALELYRHQQVLSISIEPLATQWLIKGQVQGTQPLPYEVSVELKRSPEGRVLDWVGECTCPVEVQCKHAIALMIKAAYKGQTILGESSPQPTYRPQTEQE